MKTHFTHNYITNPRHRVTVNLIGAGGTGSQVVGALARMDYALYKLGHPGLSVTIIDDDIVTEANIGRQLFSASDIGLSKANVLATRINSFYGVDWEAKQERYNGFYSPTANITITCVDNVASRISIGKNLRSLADGFDDRMCIYWLDFGNQLDRGQVILGTLKDVEQPKSRKYKTVKNIKCVDEFFDLSEVKDEDSGPSCSLAEALRKQDLFVNSFLAQTGCALLWKLFYDGNIDMQGAFVNLATMNVNPIKL